MASKVEIPSSKGLNKPEEGIVKRRPMLHKPRSVSSPTAISKSSESFSKRALAATVTDCDKDEDAGSDDAAPPSFSSTHTTSTTGPNVSSAGSNGTSSSSSNQIQSTGVDLVIAPKDNNINQNIVRERREPRNRRLSRASQRPNSINLSESESSMATQDSMRHPARDPDQFKPNRRSMQISPSISSSTPSTTHNELFSERQIESRSDSSWSPQFHEYAVVSHPPPPFSPLVDTRFGAPNPFSPQHPVHHYGAPETPRGIAPTSFFPPPQPPQQIMPAPPPAFPPSTLEQPYLSGYELLAAKLTGDVGGPPVKPIYRRFDAITHRILLSLQDQIVTLEETLRDIDATDSANRQEADLPASEREERESHYPFHMRKGSVLGQLSQKLQNYNTLLASFRDNQCLHSPSAGDIQDYKEFLAAERPIAEPETRFLNAPDLIVLEPNRMRPQKALADQGHRQVMGAKRWIAARRALLNRGPLQELIIGVIAAAFSPLVTFPVIRDFAGRMTIVILSGVVICTVLFRSGMFNPLASTQNAQDFIICGGIYIGGMAVLSWLLR